MKCRGEWTRFNLPIRQNSLRRMLGPHSADRLMVIEKKKKKIIK